MAKAKRNTLTDVIEDETGTLRGIEIADIPINKWEKEIFIAIMTKYLSLNINSSAEAYDRAAKDFEYIKEKNNGTSAA